MATSNQLTTRAPVAGPGIGGGSIRAVRATIALAAGDLTLNAVHQAIDLPPGFTVLQGAIWATDMDTAGSPALAFHVGDADDPDRYFVASTVGQAGTASEALARTGYGYTTTGKSRVIVTVSTAAGTAAGGTLDVVLFGTVADPV
jgi:hypothetical protein